MGATGSSISHKNVEIGEEISRSTTLYRIWTNVYSCLLNKRRKCTLFIRHFAETDSNETRSFFENGIKTIVKLRHPYIVEYVDSTVSLSEATLLTERVQVLDLVIDSLSPIEIHTGITQILDALVFLHEKASLSHNNICPSSVFVALDGRWKLNGFEFAQKLENSRHWVQTDFVRSVKLPEFAPAEDQLMLSTDIPPAARDAFAFGKLIAYVLPYIKERLLAETVTALNDVVKRLTNDDPSGRGDLSSLFSAFPAAFTNNLSTMMDFLQHFHSKTSGQKSAFFESAANDLKTMPKDVVGKRLIPLLLSRYVLLDKSANGKLLPYVLQPNDNDCEDGLFSRELFKRWVGPQILRIFHVHEASIRLALLSHFSRFVTAISKMDLEDMVLPELILGIKDTDDRIVSASLRAMADLVPILGGSVVTGLVRKKVFADGKPKGDQHINNDSGQSLTEDHLVDFGSKKDPLPISLSNLLEEDHSEFPTVTLKLVKGHDEVPSCLEKAGGNDVADPVEDIWGESWESADDTQNPSEESSSCTTLAQSSLPKSGTEGIKEGMNLMSDKGSFDCMGSGYGVPEIGKILNNELEESEEPNYFADMEPVVSSAPKLVIQLEENTNPVNKAEKFQEIKQLSDRFAPVAAEEDSVNLEVWGAESVADWDED